MKVGVIKITAYGGLTPSKKYDRMGIDNNFWPTSPKKVFKIGKKSTVASAVILSLGQVSAVLAQCAVEFQIKVIFDQWPKLHLGLDAPYLFCFWVKRPGWMPVWMR